MEWPKSAIFHGRGSLTRRAMQHILCDHYLKRKPPMTDTFEMWTGDDVVAVVTFGVPASRHMQKGACPTEPDKVVELNRLWIADHMPKNSASCFLAQCLKKMQPMIVLSYADTAAGHMGYVYRACNFNYAGWTDMDRKTPRFDYLVPGKHTRDAFRSGLGAQAVKVRRKPKVRYWTVSGTGRERKRLIKLCRWPIMCWRSEPPPTEHKQRNEKEQD